MFIATKANLIDRLSLIWLIFSEENAIQIYQNEQK